MEVSVKRGSTLFYDPYPGDPQKGNPKVNELWVLEVKLRVSRV